MMFFHHCSYFFGINLVSGMMVLKIWGAEGCSRNF